MGYVHTWRRPRVIEPETFRHIRIDFHRLLDPLAQRGVRLGDAWGEHQPIIHREQIIFNGSANCNCLPTPCVRIATSHQGSSVATLPRPELSYDLSWSRRRCPGSCDYETFMLRRVEDARAVGDDRRIGDWCDTDRRPYDLAVMAALLVARRHIGASLEVWTPGRREWWDEAKDLTEQVLGYGRDTEFWWWTPPLL